MSARRLVLAAVALAVATTACAAIEQPSASPTAAFSPASTILASASGSPVVEASELTTPAPTIDPTLAHSTIVRCETDGIRFAGDLLLQPARAELGGDAAAAELRSVIAGSAPENGLPLNGWTRIDASPTRVLFVARTATGWSQVALALGPTGWASDIEGQCALRPVLPPGIGPAAWWVDPQAAGLPADATTVHALLREEACASGKTPAGRVVGPAFLEDATRVIVTFGVRPRAGGQDCQGNPSFALRFTLPSPLGGRALLDGGVFPPRDALTEAP
jgi:hypothetical protein